MTKALDTPLVRIVDDDAEQLKSLAFLLRMGGWEVMTYQSAAAFLEMDDPRQGGKHCEERNRSYSVGAGAYEVQQGQTGGHHCKSYRCYG